MVRVSIAIAAALVLLGTGVATSASDSNRLLGAPAVQGHSTFVTLEIEPVAPPPLFGLAVCKHRVEVPGIFKEIMTALGSCRDELGAIFATPSAYPAPAPGTALTTTGRERVHPDPFGRAWATTEYTFALDGGGHGVTWVVRTAETATHPKTQEEYNFVLALPPLPKGASWDTLILTPGTPPAR